MRILLTGASFFIGAALWDRLLSDGHEVHAVGRHAAPAKADPACWHQADLLCPSEVSRVVGQVKPDALCHLASMRAEHHPERDQHWVLTSNLSSTYNLLEACRTHSLRPRIVFTSGMGVYRFQPPGQSGIGEDEPVQPEDIYGLGKVCAEAACAYFHHHHGWPLTVVRISGVYGPGKPGGIIYNCLRAARDQSTVSLPGAEVVRDLVYVDDVVEALEAALTRAPEGYRMYHVGGGQAVSLGQVVEVVQKVTGKSFPVSRPAERSAGNQFLFDISQAKSELGYNPRSIEAGVAAYWKHMEGGQS